MTSLLGNPIVAAILGAVFGVALILVSRWSFTLVSPETGYVGLAAATVALFLRMVLAAAVMYVYLLYARPGFWAFAAACLIAFFAVYMVELFRYGGPKRALGHARSKEKS